MFVYTFHSAHLASSLCVLLVMNTASLIRNSLWQQPAQDSISQWCPPLPTSQPVGRWRALGGCVSLARFQDLALAHWKHSAGKDTVQRGIHHLQHRFLVLDRSLSYLPLKEASGQRRWESKTHTEAHTCQIMQLIFSVFFEKTSR